MLEKIMEEYIQSKYQTAKHLLDELKNGCETYKDVENSLQKFKQHVRWKYGLTYEYLFTDIEDILNKEKNDLPITNRSDHGSQNFNTDDSG